MLLGLGAVFRGSVPLQGPFLGDFSFLWGCFEGGIHLVGIFLGLCLPSVSNFGVISSGGAAYILVGSSLGGTLSPTLNRTLEST